MSGDGFKTALHCLNASSWHTAEPDANPIHCNGNSEDTKCDQCGVQNPSDIHTCENTIPPKGIDWQSAYQTLQSLLAEAADALHKNLRSPKASYSSADADTTDDVKAGSPANEQALIDKLRAAALPIMRADSTHAAPSLRGVIAAVRAEPTIEHSAHFEAPVQSLQRVRDARNECLCKDKCLHVGMALCKGLPSPLAEQPAPDKGYSIDTNPSGIGKRVADTIIGVLALGPDRYWIQHFLNIGRAGTSKSTAQPAHIQNDDSALTCALAERDEHHEMADKLAEKIAEITGAEIGEHTSANFPWRNALHAADEWIAAKPAEPLADVKTLQAIADEYNAWIKHHAAGHDFDDFLKQVAQGLNKAAAT